MARCTHCSAPLPANTNLCTYCGTRNDVDLHGKQAYSVERMVSERICPNCGTTLQTVRLNLDKPFAVERCDTCFGLFFDPGEVEILLESSVSNVFDINTLHLDNINKDRYLKNQQFRYVKCPACRVLMNRVNFGQRSGVVVDQCKIHGIWLDNGELTHLLEWKKAGGQLLQQKAAELEQQRKKPRGPLPASANDYGHGANGGFRNGFDVDLLETVAAVIYKLFDKS
jgi:Zn-finger nucleic acid-binding protein